MIVQDGRSRGLAAGALLMILAIFVMAGCGGGGNGGNGNGAADWQLRVTDLGTLGGDAGQALAVNQSGQVVGWSRLPGTDTFHAFLWDNGNMTELGTLEAGGNSQASGINSQGVICGTSDVAGANQRAFRYAGGQMEDIGALSPWVNAAAMDINDAGDIVGDASNHAFIWRDGQIQEMPTPEESGWATAVNSRGTIAGVFWRADLGASHAFRGTATRAVDLDPAGTSRSWAYGINDAGAVVGCRAEGQYRHAFIYRRGSMRHIGSLGGNQAEAHGINNDGVIVGFDFAVTQGGHVVHAFVWDGAMHDLNDLLDQQSQGWTLVRALAISDNNLIVGHGRNPLGQYRPFLAQPN
ncbi:MAG: hypothetical protein ACOX9R_14145 [Armatimonadota bacterium]|jgi:probable HAF family extracellular repeat protein